jgi:hypothetical protein
MKVFQMRLFIQCVTLLFAGFRGVVASRDYVVSPRGLGQNNVSDLFKVYF